MQVCKHNYFDRRVYDYEIWQAYSRNFFLNILLNITNTLKLKKHPSFDGQSLFGITDYFNNKRKCNKNQRKNMILKRTHFHLLCFHKKTCLKRSSLYLVVKHLQLKTLLLRSWKIQFISTQKKLTNIFNECPIYKKFPTYWKEQI